jgi:hypothetical protein
MLDETFTACPACSLNARGAKLTNVFAAWNVVTHGHKLRSRSCFVLTLSSIRSQGAGESTEEKLPQEALSQALKKFRRFAQIEIGKAPPTGAALLSRARFH